MIARNLAAPAARLTAIDVDPLELREGEGLSVGRHPANDVVLPEPLVSRFHARVRWEPGAARPVVEDLGSQNGVFLDGRRVERRAPLRHGARLVVGATAFEVALEGAEETAALRDDADDRVTLFSDPGVPRRGSFAVGPALAQALLDLEVHHRTGQLTVEPRASRPCA